MLTRQLSSDTTLIRVDSTTSTQDEITSRQQPPRTACLAQHQTQGRGRRGKTWLSPKHQHLYLSYGDHTSLSLNALQGLTLAIAIRTCDAIESLVAVPHPLTIKWPNDIYYADKKLGGFLLETEPSQREATYLVLGIGLNLGSPPSPTSIHHPATSLSAITSTTISNTTLTHALISTWQTCLEDFTKHGLAYFLTDWKSRDLLDQHNIEYQLNGATHTGQAQGINQHGQLLIQHHDQQHACQPEKITLIRPID